MNEEEISTSKIDILQFQLKQLWEEVFFRREREWKTVYAFSFFLLGAAGWIYSEPFTLSLSETQFLLPFTLFVSTVTIRFLFINVDKAGDAANVITGINKELQMFDQKIYGHATFPEKWKKWGGRKFAFYLHILFIVISALLLMLVIIDKTLPSNDKP